MEKFNEKFYIEKGAEMYIEDFIKLEELMKADDKSDQYGMNFNAEIYFKYQLNYLKNGISTGHSFSSIKNMTNEYEGVDIERLDIEKKLYEGSTLQQDIVVEFSKKYLFVSISGDNIRWVKTMRLLLEDFFENRISKTGKYNYWINKKIHWYSPLLVGSLIGIGLATSTYSLVIVAGIIFALTGFISFPSNLNKMFPVNRISLQKKPKEYEGKKESSIGKFLKVGLNTIFWGLILFGITYFITQYLTSL